MTDYDIVSRRGGNPFEGGNVLTLSLGGKARVGGNPGIEAGKDEKIE